jgi:hypothetical protein
MATIIIELAKGTKEIVPVLVDDTTDGLGSLTGTSPKFDLLKEDESTIYSAANASSVGMRMDCLIDLSAAGPGGLIAAGTRLRLFVTFTNGSEQPRLGPIVILVIDRPL